jgi:hypothetical protein
VVFLAGAVGCGSGRTLAGGTSGGPVTLAGDIQPIFRRQCALAGGCHLGDAAALGMDLSEGQSLLNTVNVPSAYDENLIRVVPRDSANSFLYQKITQDSPAFGSRMPLTGTLVASDIDLIRRWIDEGANP